MSWTEQRIQQLVEMWGSGLSASEIARRLGGVTRNAVIGKVHRLKLSSRASPIRAENRASRLALPRQISSAPRKKMLRATPAMPSATARSVGTTIQRPSQQELDTPSALALSPLKATERHCRWPFGDPRSTDFKYCGCQPVEGLPYCSNHARAAYQNYGRSQRRQHDEAAG